MKNSKLITLIVAFSEAASRAGVCLDIQLCTLVLLAALLSLDED